MKNIFITLTLLFCYIISFSQVIIERQVIGSTGNILNTGVIQTTSTVGEALIQTFLQPTLIMTQGFIQPDTMIIVKIEIMDNSLIHINVYPNPTKNLVTINFETTKTMEIDIEVYNKVGQNVIDQMQINVLNNCKHELDFSNLTSGIYFLVIKSNSGDLCRRFTIQKIN